MLRRLFSRTPQDPRPAAIYAAIVAASRQPAFYTSFGIADTVEGRFELLVLHAGLVTLRLSGGSEVDRALSQAVFDLMFADLDRGLRELGVGDLSVPKKIRKMAEAYYGRARAYAAALGDDAPAEALTAVIARNVYDPETEAPAAAVVGALAAYVRVSHGRMATAEPERLRQGEVGFPNASDYEPEPVVAAS